MYLQEYLGPEYSVINAGVVGTNAKTYFERYKSYIDVSNIDVAIVMFGANGGFTDTFKEDVDQYSNYFEYRDTVTGCTCKLVEWLEEQNPKIQIIMMTPTYCDLEKASENANQIERQVKLMPKFIYRYHYPLIDIYNLEGVNARNSDYWLANDGVHQNKEAYEKIGRIVSNYVKLYYKD